MSFIPLTGDKRQLPSRIPSSSSSNVSQLVTSHRTLLNSTSRILTHSAKNEVKSSMSQTSLNGSAKNTALSGSKARHNSSSSSLAGSSSSTLLSSSPQRQLQQQTSSPSILSYPLSDSTDWNERCKSFESVSEYVNDFSNELVSKQKRLQELFIQGLKDKHPKVAQKTMAVIEDYLKRPDSLPLLVTNGTNGNPSQPTLLGLEFLGNMLPLILANSVVMPTNSNRGSISEGGMNVIFLFKTKFASKHMCSAITSIINNPHWCQNPKIAFGCIVLLSILDINELEEYCRKKAAFKALLNGIGGLCADRESGIVKNIKVLLATLFTSTGSVAFLEAYSKITAQKRTAIARIFGIRHGDISNDLKAFEESVAIELKSKKLPARSSSTKGKESVRSSYASVATKLTEKSKNNITDATSDQIGTKSNLSMEAKQVAHPELKKGDDEDEVEEDEDPDPDDIMRKFNHVSPSIEDLQDLVRRRAYLSTSADSQSSTTNFAIPLSTSANPPNRLVPFKRDFIGVSATQILNTPIKELLPDQYVYDIASKFGQISWNFFKLVMVTIFSVASLVLKLSILTIGFTITAIKDKAAAGKMSLLETTETLRASVTRLYSNEDLRDNSSTSTSKDFSNMNNSKIVASTGLQSSQKGLADSWKNKQIENIADIKYDFDYQEDAPKEKDGNGDDCTASKSEENDEEENNNLEQQHWRSNNHKYQSTSSPTSYNYQKLETRSHIQDFDSDATITSDQPEINSAIVNNPSDRLVFNIKNSGNNNGLARIQIKKQSIEETPLLHKSVDELNFNLVPRTPPVGAVREVRLRDLNQDVQQQHQRHQPQPAPTYQSIITVTMTKNTTAPRQKGFLRRSVQGAVWFVPILGWRVNRVIDGVCEIVEKPDGLTQLHVVNI